MTALATAFARPKRGVGRQISVPVNASSVIHKGGLVALDSDGFAIPAADTASTRVVGVAIESKTGGASDGDVRVIVEYDAEFLFTASSITRAMTASGAAMCVVDDNTVDDAAGPTNDIYVGQLTDFVSTTSGWVYVPGLMKA
jgi:hypothetical protein